MGGLKVSTLGPADGSAWITGASSGIGRATALRLARDGWTVFASARDGAKLIELAREADKFGGTVHPFPVDVTVLEDVQTVVDKIETKHGRIALAVLNAGTFTKDGVDRFQASDFERQLDVNFLGTVKCLQPLLGHFLARRSGHIAIMASVAGYGGLPMAMGYGASKAALINLAEALRLECQPYNVKVQVINPGFIKTELTDKNDFPMPFLMDLDDAVDALVRGLKRPNFEIAFPRRFAFLLKRLRGLPYGLYFALVSRATGVNRRERRRER
ncbi:MAG: SDR family NAD(P)-dependent oxidoreductase [Pseudomonadota bacterium]